MSCDLAHAGSGRNGKFQIATKSFAINHLGMALLRKFGTLSVVTCWPDSSCGDRGSAGAPPTRLIWRGPGGYQDAAHSLLVRIRASRFALGGEVPGLRAEGFCDHGFRRYPRVTVAPPDAPNERNAPMSHEWWERERRSSLAGLNRRPTRALGFRIPVAVCPRRAVLVISRVRGRL